MITLLFYKITQNILFPIIVCSKHAKSKLVEIIFHQTSINAIFRQTSINAIYHQVINELYVEE